MKLRSTAALALLTVSPAYAATVLDFETVTSFASVAEFYNAGADSAGKVGPALGVSFGGDALSLQNDALGPYFSNAPSPAGVMAPVGAAATMNVPLGFAGAIGLYYSSSAVVSNAVQVWSGSNGGGTLLASFSLAANAQSGGCSSSAFCRFDPLSSTFAGVARSVTFGNAANVAAFDNIAITSVPEPATALLWALGLAGVAVARRRGRGGAFEGR